MNLYCTTCKKYLPTNQFHKKVDAYRSYRYTCKSCRKIESKKQYNSDIARDKSLRRLYGITLKDYNEMREEQDYCCALCRIHENSLKGIKKRLTVDHDAITGFVRQLLCGDCNSGIGLLKHDPELLRAAADYLEDNVL